MVSSRKCATALAAAGVLLVSAACSSSGGSDSKGGGKITWGIDAELSGPISYYGGSIAGGVQAYVDQVNAQGGINGAKIQLTRLDNAADQSRSAANATQLITADKATAIFGQVLDADCSGAAPIADRYKVPLACLSVGKDSPYSFSLGWQDNRAATAMLGTAKKLVTKSSINAAVLMPTTALPKLLGEALKAKAASQGITISSFQSYDITATDLSTETSKIVAAKPDVILISATSPGLLSVLKGVRAAGVQAPLIWVDGTGNLAALATSTDPGIYTLQAYQMVDPGNASGVAKDYLSAVAPQLKGKSDIVSVNAGDYTIGYATARAFGEALKACGGASCSGEELKAQLEKSDADLNGLISSFSFKNSDHYPFSTWYVYHVVGSKYDQFATFPSDAPNS